MEIQRVVSYICCLSKTYIHYEALFVRDCLQPDAIPTLNELSLELSHVVCMLPWRSTWLLLVSLATSPNFSVHCSCYDNLSYLLSVD